MEGVSFFTTLTYLFFISAGPTKESNAILKDNDNNVCKICNKSFSERSSLLRHFLMMHDKNTPIKPDVHPEMAILKRKMPTEPNTQQDLPKRGRPPKFAKIELPTNPIPVVKYMPRQAPNEGARPQQILRPPVPPIQNIAITPARIGMFYFFCSPLKSYKNHLKVT
jgi:hypothetical protein